MKKIVFTALSGLPFEDSGGPNKVISQIISKIDKTKFDAFYLSKNIFFQFNSKDKHENSYKNQKLRIAQKLFHKSKLYQRIFTSSLYLNYFFRKSVRLISNFLSSNNWDIIHSHDVRTLFNYQKRNEKVILTIHSKGSIVKDMMQLYGQRRSLKKMYQMFNELEKKSLEIADVITFPSQSARDLFFNDINSNEYEKKTQIIYNGINLDRINKIEIDDVFNKKWKWLEKYEYRILTVGAHIESKNINQILKTFSIVNKIKPNKCYLICIGSGVLSKELYKLAEELQVMNNMSFINYLSNDDILKLMKKCNVYISLSKRVIFDLVILEALACGMNVIASNDGGNREIIDDNNGKLVEEDDIEIIADIIINSNLQRNQNAVESVKRFSIENMISNYQKIYE